MQRWWSIEVLDGAFAASIWMETQGDRIAEQAIMDGALDWQWHTHHMGVVFEVAFRDSESWEKFLDSFAMRLALDVVPDPSAVLIYQGRGTAGSIGPRKPKPLIGSGAASLALPVSLDEELKLNVFGPLPLKRLAFAGSF